MKNENRLLIKDDKSESETEININDGIIVKYTGIYYKQSKSIETPFIGLIETSRSTLDIVTGIYIKPLYIFNNNKWNKIINYKEPIYKYFSYPHLLMIPNIHYNHLPLYFLHTIEKMNINYYKDCDTTNTIELEY